MGDASQEGRMQSMQGKGSHLFQSTLRDRNQASPECFGFHAQAAHHIPNLHLLKLIAPFPLLVHVTPDFPDSPARIYAHHCQRTCRGTFWRQPEASTHKCKEMQANRGHGYGTKVVQAYFFLEEYASKLQVWPKVYTLRCSSKTAAYSVAA